MSADNKAVLGKHLEAAAQDAKDYIDTEVAKCAKKTDILQATVTVSATDPQDDSIIWFKPIS